MGDTDGLTSAIMNQGENQEIYINKNNYFSFAFGDEIALVLHSKDNIKFYILNCDKKLWDKVYHQVIKLKTLPKIKSWWKEQSKNYVISTWSDDFGDL